MDTQEPNSGSVLNENPPVETNLKPDSKIKSNQLPIISLAAFIILALGAIGFLYYQNQQLKAMLAKYQTPAPTSTPIATIDPTANWTTYTNNKIGFEFKSPNKLSEINADGSVTVSGKTYITKQSTEENTLTKSDVTVRVIYGWTKVESDPYGQSTYTKQTINGNDWFTAYTENKTNEPGCFSSSAHILTSNQKDTIEIGVVEPCPSDTKIKKSLTELNQILSTFKFIGAKTATPTASPKTSTPSGIPSGY